MTPRCASPGLLAALLLTSGCTRAQPPVPVKAEISAALSSMRTLCARDSGCVMVAPVTAGKGADAAGAATLSAALPAALKQVVEGKVEGAPTGCESRECLKALKLPLLAEATLARTEIGWGLSVTLTGPADAAPIGSDFLQGGTAEELAKRLAAPGSLWVLAAGTKGLPLRHDPALAAAQPIEWLASKPAGVSFARSETTLAQYRLCVEAGACTVHGRGEGCEWERQDREDHPVNCVDKSEGEAFCAWAGGRLPTGDEWYAEATASGTRRFPWGGDPGKDADDAKLDCAHGVWSEGSGPKGCGNQSSAKVCSHPAGNSVSGLCDLSGNVLEWTSRPGVETGELRGTSWKYDRQVAIVPPSRGGITNFPWWGEMGFRCVREAAR